MPPTTTKRSAAKKSAAKKGSARKSVAKAPARRSAPAVEPLRSRALVVAVDDAPTTVVGLQATFSIGSNTVTLETPDISTISKGIQFQLSKPANLGSLNDFLTWAGTQIPGFPSGINTSTWPAPFNGVAAMTVTIDAFCINNQVDPALFTIAMSINADPKNKPTIPVINVSIDSLGFRVSKGDCPGSIKAAS
jgi:hypothetical protein